MTLDRDLPQRAPSFFFIDIQPDEIAGFDALLAGFPDVSNVERGPSLRGRLTALNGTAVEQAPVAPEAQGAIRSERGLTYAARLPLGSHLVAGEWGPADCPGPALVFFGAG